jgi:hypothetical protein
MSKSLLLITTTEPMYELVITNNKGYDLFTTTGIPRGTRVLT